MREAENIHAIESLKIDFMGFIFYPKSPRYVKEKPDYFLFDTACPSYGGSGRRFDWKIIKDYSDDTPFLLSGGIQAHSRQI